MTASSPSLLIAIDCVTLMSLVESHRTRYAEFVKTVGRSADAVKHAVDTVSESFSGSWFGWHAEMYYGDFEKPPWGQLFNVEWGAYHGLPPGWQRRKKAEVDNRVEKLSHQGLAELSKQRWELARAMKELQDEFLAGLAPILNMTTLIKERELLQKLDEYRWDDSVYDEFLRSAQDAAPHATRDSQAAIQGFKRPPHVECLALAHAAESFAVSAEEFWALGIRLIRHLKAHASVAVQAGADSHGSVDIVLSVCESFHLVATELQSRHGNRATIAISDEFDVQDLLRALLRQRFSDVRPEELAPSTAGRAPRMDFLLKPEKIVVEVKMTREGLRDKEVGDELLQDIARYKGHPDCSILVCFLYDPKGLLKNPYGLASDIEKQSDAKLTVRAVISPRRT